MISFRNIWLAKAKRLASEGMWQRCFNWITQLLKALEITPSWIKNRLGWTLQVQRQLGEKQLHWVQSRWNLIIQGIIILMGKCFSLILKGECKTYSYHLLTHHKCRNIHQLKIPLQGKTSHLHSGNHQSPLTIRIQIHMDSILVLV